METTIELHSLRKTYRPRAGPAVAAVQDVQLTVAAGQTVGILGAYGAGKTTIIKLVGGLVKPTVGTVRLRGHDIVSERDIALRQVGVLLTDRPVQPAGRTVTEHLLYAGRASDLERHKLQTRVEQLLHQCDLWTSRNSIIRRLSPGQQRLVALSSVLIADPLIVLLDEPTAGLDGADSRAILTVVRHFLRGKTMLLATSHVAIACDLCERVAVLNNGRLVAERTRQELLDLFRQERYSIRVKGHLSPSWSEWFDGLTMVNEEGGDAVISGPIADQSALHGVLARVHALNLTLIDVSRSEPSLDDVFTQL
jgi:ABC-2 type transport system ATP-binding protein